jgi:uncharacterized damage-inducible protein DinB
MNSLLERYRRWYDYERDCNAKILAMLESIPADRRGTPEFEKALGRAGHLIAARRRWLHRLGKWPELPPIFPTELTIAELTRQFAETEAAWVAYLNSLGEDDLARVIEWTAPNGQKFRWDIEGILTQMLIHAPYHRGQLAQLVALLGGKAVDTDYLFWCNPAV